MSSPAHREPSTAARAPRFLLGFGVGAAVALGWTLHDLAVVATNGDPRAALALVPAHALACVVGGLLGMVLAAGPVVALLAVAAAVLLAAAPRLGLELPARLHDLARVLVLGTLAMALTLHAGRLRGRTVCAERGLLAGLALGVLACAALTRWREDPRYVIVPLAAAAGLALPLICLPRPLWRRCALLLVGVAALVLVARTSQRRFPPPRPDLPPPERAAADGPSLLLVVLDTVRADHLGAYGYERETTPRLDAWARAHALRYVNARSPSSWTLPAHASLFTGLRPGEHGATHVRSAPAEAGVDGRRGHQRLAYPLHAGVPTLAEVLREAGFQTAGIFANHVFLGRDYGLERGFEHHDARRGTWIGGPPDTPRAAGYRTLVQRAGFALRPGHVPYQDARSVTERALAWLREKRRDGRFFLALNYMDAHAPQLPPAPFARLFDERRPADPLTLEDELLALLYDRELAYLDSQLGRLFDELETLGLHEDTVVVVTSDHGEAFGEHGFWNHDWTLYEEVVRVPLLVKPAGAPRAAEVSDEEVSLTDVPALALGLLGLADTRFADRSERWFGEWYRIEDRSLRESKPFLRDKDLDRDLVSWIEDGVKLIVASNGTVEAFALDPLTGAEVAITLEPARLEAARARARAWWEAHPPPTANAAEVDEERLRQLRALGYMGEE